MKKSDLLALKFGELVLNKRWWVIALTLIIVTLATMGGERLVFNNDYRAFFNGDNPELLAFEHMENTYSGRDENVFIVLAPKNGNIFTRENLAAVEKYTKAAWQTPHSTRVDSITNFQNSHANGDELIVEELVKGTKIDVIKYKAKSRYRKKIGFRPQFSRILIEDIKV